MQLLILTKKYYIKTNINFITKLSYIQMSS